MPGGNGFFPPVQFSAVWTVLGVLLVLVVLAWFIVVPVLTRPRTRREPTPDELHAFALDTRSRYIELIDDVGVAHFRAEISGREAHQQLSSLVRGYAAETSGFPATSMTLTELRQLNLPGLTDAVAQYYPSEFGTRERGSVADSIEEAKRVVQQWH